MDAADVLEQRAVSILAHPERWALRSMAFRPIPAYQLVSILAHPERWALHGLRVRDRTECDVSILAHPERWALRADGGRFKRISLFQSSPTPKGGRYEW